MTRKADSRTRGLGCGCIGSSNKAGPTPQIAESALAELFLSPLSLYSFYRCPALRLGRSEGPTRGGAYVRRLDLPALGVVFVGRAHVHFLVLQGRRPGRPKPPTRPRSRPRPPRKPPRRNRPRLRSPPGWPQARRSCSPARTGEGAGHQRAHASAQPFRHPATPREAQPPRPSPSEVHPLTPETLLTKKRKAVQKPAHAGFLFVAGAVRGGCEFGDCCREFGICGGYANEGLIRLRLVGILFGSRSITIGVLPASGLIVNRYSGRRLPQTYQTFRCG